jgi:hypothetical protein
MQGSGLIVDASRAELARRALLSNPERSNGAIAALAGVSRGTVSRVRQALAAAGLVPHWPGSRVPVPDIPALPARPA